MGIYDEWKRTRERFRELADAYHVLDLVLDDDDCLLHLDFDEDTGKLPPVPHHGQTRLATFFCLPSSKDDPYRGSVDGRPLHLYMHTPHADYIQSGLLGHDEENFFDLAVALFWDRLLLPTKNTKGTRFDSIMRSISRDIATHGVRAVDTAEPYTLDLVFPTGEVLARIQWLPDTNALAVSYPGLDAKGFTVSHVGKVGKRLRKESGYWTSKGWSLDPEGV